MALRFGVCRELSFTRNAFIGSMQRLGGGNMIRTRQPMFRIDHVTVLKQLKATPRRIAALTRGLHDHQLTLKPSVDTWSANEVLAHLRACADVWGGSIMTILTQDHPTFRYVSPRAWIRKTNYCDLKFGVSFVAFTNQRKNLLKVLQTLAQDDWLRGASVKAATKIRRETVLSYGQRMAQHEAGHCEQIERILRFQ
jgi:hypothetical protein